MTPCRMIVGLGRGLLLALLAVLLTAQTASAQRRASRDGGYSQPTVHRRGPVTQTNETDLNAESGVCQGRISKFELTDPAQSDDEDLVGVLKIRPSQSGGRLLKLKVPDDESVRISVDGHSLSLPEYPEILRKGSFCSVRWGTEEGEDGQKSRNAPKLLRSLELETMVVQGRIDEIGDDYLVLVRSRPQDGRQWPDVAAYLTRASATSASKKISLPARKKLELSFVEPVTAFADAEGAPLYLSDFTEGEDVEAVIVYGGKRGLLIELRSLVSYNASASNETTGASHRPIAPSHASRYASGA